MLHHFKMKRLRLRIRKVFMNWSSTFSRRLEFLGSNSGIHGLKQIFDRSNFTLSRLFWIVIVLISSGCLYLLLVPTMELSDQVNFTPDTRYLSWDTTFPAVTICETYTYKTALNKCTELYPNLIEPLNVDMRRYLVQIANGHGSCSKKGLCKPCGSVVPCDLDWREMIEKVHKSCTELIADCTFNGEKFSCCKKFRLVDSEYGYCFAFNTLQNVNSGDEPLYTVNRTTGPGKLQFRALTDLHVSVHSPEELATDVLDTKFKFDVKVSSDDRKQYVNYLFSMVEMENDMNLLTEEIEVRGCRTYKEIPEGSFHTYPTYSYGACLLAEDTEHLFEDCNCVHPVRDTAYRKHYCNFTGINCLIMTRAQEQKLGIDHHENDEDCLPSCDESELTTIHISKRLVTDKQPGTMVTVQMASLPTLRYTRNLIRTDLDTVVAIGGMVSLFFAASVLSIVEIFYLLLRSQ